MLATSLVNQCAQGPTRDTAQFCTTDDASNPDEQRKTFLLELWQSGPKLPPGEGAMRPGERSGIIAAARDALTRGDVKEAAAIIATRYPFNPT